MAEAGFLEQKARPGSAALVVLMHGAGIAALLLAGTHIVRPPEKPVTEVTNVTPTPIPVEIEPEPQTREPQPERQTHQSRLDTVDNTPLPTLGPVVTGPPIPPQPPVGDIAPERQPLEQVILPPRIDPPAPPPPPPVRVSARINTSNLQPPYPASLQREQIEGSATVRVTIGADGRVVSVQKVSATHELFYTATARHAQARWRFRPATVDGRAVESTQTMTVQFRLDE